MAQYANKTEVPVERTQTEIRRLVETYNATGYLDGWQGGRVVVMFEMHSRRVRFTITLPRPDEDRFLWRDNRQVAASRARQLYDQEVRSLWRALFLTIKAKLVSIESGVETFEEAFAAQVVLPDGQTVGEWLAPQVAESYRTRAMPPLLPGVTGEPHRLGKGSTDG